MDSTAALAAGKLIDDLLCADGRVKNDWYTRLLQPYSQFLVSLGEPCPRLRILH